MDNLVSFLVEKLGSIPKLIDACSFYITCAGIKEIANPIIFFTFMVLGYRVVLKFFEIAKDEFSR